jgi:hypothetical protein
MNSLTLVTSSLFVGACLSLAGPATNLLENGAFKNWAAWEVPTNATALPTIVDNLAPTGCWLNAEAYEKAGNPEFPVTVTIRRDLTVKHGDNVSVKVENGSNTDIGAVVFKPIAVIPNQTYKLSVWYKGEDIQMFPKLDDGVGICLWVTQGPAEHYWENLTMDLVAPELHQGTFEWKRFEHTFTTKANTERVSIAAQIRRAKGTAWFTEFELVQVP